MASIIESALQKIVGASGAGLVAYGFVSQCIFTVDGGQRAVLFDRGYGVLPRTYADGAHFKIPWWQEETIFDVKMRPKLVKNRTATKDMQQVNIAVRLLHRPEIEDLPLIWKELGVNYEDVVLPSIMNEVMKMQVAKYNAEELLTKRKDVRSRICLWPLGLLVAACFRFPNWEFERHQWIKFR
jgi:regulator of protease activity HflC (stomatin/prohibitin superfamily)